MQAASRDGTVQPDAGQQSQPEPVVVEPMAPSGWTPERRDWVTVVLVVHNGVRWLPRALEALAASSRRPDRVVAVDTGSTDGSDRLLLDSPVVESIITKPAEVTFGAAVAAAEESLPVVPAAAVGPGAGQQAPAVEWLWLLHDDSAPEPAALEELLEEAQRSQAGVLGPKVRGWHDRALLVECGLSVTNSGRRYTGIGVGDRDQGQRDDLTDVLAVGSAGMLVRRELWQRLGGFDRRLPMYGDDIEFCIRARRADERVVVVPSAVIHHREAAVHGVRTQPAVTMPASLAGRSAAMYTTLVHGPALLLPFTSVALLLRALVSALITLISDGPRRAAAELRVWGGVHLHPIRVLRARRNLRATAAVPRRDLRDLRPGLVEQWSAALDHSAAGMAATRRSDMPSPPLGLGRALVVAALLALIAAAATRGVWMAPGQLAGGALLPPVDGTTLLQGFRAAWHDVGLGSDEPAAVYPLVLMLLASPPVVSVDFVVQILLLFTVPLAGLSAFLALRGLPSRSVRAVLAIAYGLTPAAVVPSLDGRLGTAVVAVLLPWLVRLVVRIFAGHTVAGVLPPPRVRTVAGAALLLAVVTAFAPLLWVAVGGAVLAAAVTRAREARTWIWALVLVSLPVALLWPWSWALLTDPSRAMFEAGISSPDLVAPVPPSWRLLLLDPGTLGEAVLPVAIGLVAAALLALLLPGSRGVAVWGWLLVAVGLIGATAQTSQKFVPLGATDAQYGFAGPMLHLMAAGMVIAAAGLVRDGRHRDRIAVRLVVYAALAGLLAGPLVLALQWSNDLTGPLRRSDQRVVPAFVAERAVSPQAVRTLLLDAAPDGAVAYNLVNGAGARLGDADVAPPAQTWRQLSAAVAELAAGVGPQPVAVLADNAVQYVIADSDDAELAEALDANSALRRLSTTDGRGLWLVDVPASRARLVDAAGQRPVDLLPVDRWSSGTILDTTLEPGSTGSQLRVAQAADGGWIATVAGQQATVDGGTNVVLDLPGSGPVEVTLGRDRSARDRALLVPLAALLFAGVLLLPRGQLAPPPDPDAGVEDMPPSPAAAAPTGGAA